jgi:hypothetical protein
MKRKYDFSSRSLGGGRGTLQREKTTLPASRPASHRTIEIDPPIVRKGQTTNRYGLHVTTNHSNKASTHFKKRGWTNLVAAENDADRLDRHLANNRKWNTFKPDFTGENFLNIGMDGTPADHIRSQRNGIVITVMDTKYEKCW